MPCYSLGNGGFICGFETEYLFEGYLFEVNAACGPCPLSKVNHDPRVTIPKGFDDAYDRFKALSAKEQKRYVV
jgi:hypothetical protein